MTPPKRSRRILRTLCAELGAEDGADPRVYLRRDGGRRAPKHKDRQLARQVAEAIDALLAGSTADPVLNALAVLAVEPAPDSATLLVTVSPRDPANATASALILDHLARASGWLRAEVAAAITRKRAPTLLYQVAEIGTGLR